ncbi:DUF721 domain-containing protein [Borrelia sp. A-FGy1]|uniref:DciA family protein n=1 Tax=Borrelia sp. A-FGy1 TaxID=2608247 RepID=UPI0015F643CA|nr:DciA family protein [Borrelia sp. A-FGy1]QMU99215.1 DUF721 domain-containing protein [Borrelia sp. A-FGy1]
MENLNFKKAGNILKKYLNSDIISNENLNASLLLSQNWKMIFGEFSESVKLLNLRDNKILYVEVKNSGILYSLSLRKSKIIKLINDSTGIKIVDVKVLIR